MRGIQKKRIRTLLCVLIGISFVLNEMPFLVKAEGQNTREKAVLWLAGTADKTQEWENGGLPNLTCNAMAILREEGMETDSSFLTQWEKDNAELNVDELAHLAWARKDQSYLDTVWKWQNDDGGFGLTKEYTSDIYDTLLVLLAQTAVQENSGQIETGEIEGQGEETTALPESALETVQAAVGYLTGQQREDGGFGYTGMEDSAPGLSAEIGLALLSLGIDKEELYEKLDGFCQASFTADFSEAAFYEQAELARYLYRRDCMEDTDTVETTLYAAQTEDGSVYGNAGDTIQYILLVNEIEAYHALKFSVSSLITEADSYVLEADTEQQVTLQTAVQYKVNQKFSGIIRYTLLENGEIQQTEEVECIFVPDLTEKEAGCVMKIPATEGQEYVLRTELVTKDKEDSERIWESTELTFNIHKKEKQELVLSAATSKEEDYGVGLSWNDISDGDDRYGYRVFRKQGDGDWETRSTWDGEEKVRVLNVYPGSADYLKSWMNTTISASEEIASRGVLEIDAVAFPLYNWSPDTYLKDEKGDYKYDVIMIGSADCNGGLDLSDIAYEATLAFTETGRGILFGHDSVVNNPSQVHRNLAKFGEQLGITYYKPGSGACGNKVEVINSGFLTSYPWKLTGSMNIPYAHTSGQFIDTTLVNPAIKWIRFQGYNADDDAYLFTRNQYAMIQTGHSNGQATDDERKIIANTLFYLKQLTNKTSTSDKSFYDEASPEITEVSGMSAAGQITIRAKDNGTLYQYYVEAVNAGSRDEEGIQSNIVEAEAFSGIRGFIIGISDREEAMEGLLTYDEAGSITSEILPAKDDALQYTIEGIEPGQSTYLHIYAVDYAGNVSEETVQQVTAPEAEKEYFNSPYALFASEEEAALNCCEAKINGNIYGNSAFQFQGTTLLLDGKASTAGSLSLAGGRMELAEKEEGIDSLTLPDYTEAILADIEMENEVVEELNAYNSTEIIVPTICQSTTGAWCGGVKIGASLVSEKTVSLNANTVSCGGDSRVVLCSKTGDISIQATKLDGKGLIYAPNGTVTINVSEFNYTGTIIAKKIKLQVGYLNLNQ